MKNLSINTGFKCISCKEGSILEVFILNRGHIDSSKVRYGGNNHHVPKWVTSEFSCDSCGLPFKPTEKNGLKPFLNKKLVQDILENYSEYLVKKDIPDIFILPVFSDSKVPMGGLIKGTKVFTASEGNTFNKQILNLSENIEDYYLYLDDNDKIQLFNKNDKWAESWKEFSEPIIKKARELSKKSQKRAETLLNKNKIKFSWSHNQLSTIFYLDSYPIPKPKIPVGAKLAIEIVLLDKDLKGRTYWVPKNAVKKIPEDN